MFRFRWQFRSIRAEFTSSTDDANEFFYRALNSIPPIITATPDTIRLLIVYGEDWYPILDCEMRGLTYPFISIRELFDARFDILIQARNILNAIA